MRFPLDIDLVVFICTVGKIVFGGLPRLRRISQRIPIYYKIEEIAPAALSEAQARYLYTLR